ncbi:MAG: acyltransferase [Alphaproteobacteria bacterium]|nr:acyltransferase [Alphaproteobacteria bacterium]
MTDEAPATTLRWPEEVRHIEGFDGLRALAVLLVVLFHTNGVFLPAALPGLTALARMGWSGVDLFFTLSGFLITGVLVRTAGDAHYFRNFYVRRLLRIFPLYYGVVTLVVVPRLLAGLPIGMPWWSLYAYVSNFWIAHGPQTDLALDVTWSLSIEEQFYLAWPLLVAVLPRRALVAVAVAAVAVAPWLRAQVFSPDDLAAYMYTWCRMDALALGALGALAWHHRVAGFVRATQVLAWPAALGGVALALSGWMDNQDETWAVVGYSVVAGLTTVVVLGLASGGAPSLRRLLSWAPLAHVGKVSYGIYLLHPIVLVAAAAVVPRLGLDPTAGPVQGVLTQVAVVAASVAVATLVYRTIEAPLLGLKDKLAPYGANPTTAAR